MPRFVAIGECMIELSGGAQAQYRLGFAGDTLNTAFYARASLPETWSVDFFTAVGDDIYSSQMLDFLAKNRIGTSKIQRIANKRAGLYLIHQAEGDRHFTYWRDTSAARLLADDAKKLDAAIEGADFIYFSGITLAILAPQARQRLLDRIGAARRSGTGTAFDPNIRPILWESETALREGLMQAGSVARFVLPTHADEVPYFGDKNAGDTAQRYLEAGADEVIVKNGADPALIATRAQTHTVAAQKTDRIVDATGAGDSFGGAYLAARLLGKPMDTAAQLAHRTAATVIGQQGALVDPEMLKTL